LVYELEALGPLLRLMAGLGSSADTVSTVDELASGPLFSFADWPN
jgi:hypothetical protein